MTKLEVFGPAMCCSTGVCGADVDPRLAQFAADLEWLTTQGAALARAWWPRTAPLCARRELQLHWNRSCEGIANGRRTLTPFPQIRNLLGSCPWSGEVHRVGNGIVS